MPVESDADRAVFLAASGFGCVVTYQPAGGGAAVPNLAALFDNDYLQIEGEAETSISTRAPRLLMRASDLVGEGREGDVITITSAPSQPWYQGQSYSVSEPRPDGTGMTQLWLHRIA